MIKIRIKKNQPNLAGNEKDFQFWQLQRNG